MKLVDPIKDKGYALIDNLGRVIKTADLDRILFYVPVWKHIYHTLYWFDYWFAGPENYIGASFHVQGLDSIDEPSTISFCKEKLLCYYKAIADKSRRYLDQLTDEMLGEMVDGSDTNRLGLILSQFRHSYVHIGNINCIRIMDHKWPFVSGTAQDDHHSLFE